MSASSLTVKIGRILVLIVGAPVFLAVCLVILFFIGFPIYEFVESRLCPAENRITTSDEALAFGKQHFREDRGFWQGLGVSDLEELDRLLSGKCCSASKGDYFIKDDSRWRVYIGGESEGHCDFQYEVFFSACGKRVRVEKLATRLN